MTVKQIANSLIIFLLLTVILSCSDNSPVTPNENKAPNTFISLFPDSTIAQQKSQLQVHWWSDDPDGLVIGYYFQWEGLDNSWSFTTSNDSTFSLPIGTSDTTYIFKIMAVDNSGNGKYDNSVTKNNINFGAEPFVDANNNGVYDEGEKYYDIGGIDPTPAQLKFPIKNSAPVVEWNKESSLPLESFPVITVGWNASDLDGDNSIVQINIALNDTSSFVQLPGNTRIVTLRVADLSSTNPEMEILIAGNENNIFARHLTNLKLNDNNRIYVQAVDISGASLPFVALPDTTRNWFVKKPKGNIIIFDDFEGGSSTADFYNDKFNSIFSGSLSGKFDVFDLENESLPYPNITMLQTLKLFDFCFWYSDNSPSLDVASVVTQGYVNGGGKIAFTMTFVDSSANFDFSIPLLQNFLPITDIKSQPLSFMFPGAKVVKSDSTSGFPELKTASTIGFVRNLIPNENLARKIYELDSPQIQGNIAFIDATNSIFFIGLPLDQSEGNPGTITTLIEKIMQELGIAP